jgi:WhiB family redox-sensing transcriptional regulator
MNQLDALLDAVGAAPCLPGARCRGRHTLFDPPAPGENPDTVASRHAQALGLCSRCPALSRCGDWLESLPPRKRPHGVVAGNVVFSNERLTNTKTEKGNHH